MNNLFTGRTIVILSPQPWNYLSISKHNYAKALAVRNEVFYVSPPSFAIRRKHYSYKVQDGLMVVEYSVPIPEVIKFKVNWLYQIFAQLFLVKTMRNYFTMADFCFDFGWYSEFSSSSFFPALYRIYFPVDDHKNLEASSRGSNMVLTVSTTILQKFKPGECNFINHGLSNAFAVSAHGSLSSNLRWTRGAKIRVGYSGNLFIPFIDTSTLSCLINGYQDIDFHFFGSRDFDVNNEAHLKWNYFLRSASNVKLYGRVSPERLSVEFESMDLFLICYKSDENYHSENSHKIMEYLSTGKVVVSSFISIYKGMGLLEMPDIEDSGSIKTIFDNTVANLFECNSLERMNERRRFALENTYEKNLDRIAVIIEMEQQRRLIA